MGIARRAFLGLVVGGAAGTVFSPLPWKSTDDLAIWTQNWPWIPGLPKGHVELKPGLCKISGTGYGVNYVTVGGKPCQVQGNPDHPLSRGGHDAMAPAEIKMLYGPGRIEGPMKKSGASFEKISWDEALSLLQENLRKAGRNVACISGDETGTMNEVLAGLLAGMGSGDFYLMPGEAHTASEAWNEIMNGQGQVGYDIENSDFVLMIGADALESWGTYVRNAKAFSDKRPIGEDPEATYVYAGPVCNGSAAVSDKWIGLAPGAQMHFAMGLAYHLLRMTLTAPAADFEAFRSVVMSEFTPTKVLNATGIKPEEMMELARSLVAAKRPLVITGSSFGAGGGPLSVVAGLGLNMLLGGLGRDGGVKAVPQIPSVVSGAPSRQEMLANDLVTYLARIDSGKAKTPGVLLVYAANPAYALPQADRVAAVLGKSGFKVSFSPFMDETAAMCDLLLPSPMSVERADDVVTPYGSSFLSYTMAEPVIEPVFDTRNTGDVILEVANGLGLGLGFDSFADVLAAKADAAREMGASEQGAALVSTATVQQARLSLAPKALATAAQSMQNDNTYPLNLAPVNEMAFGSDQMAMPPNNLYNVQDFELVKKDMFCRLSGPTAAKYGLAEGQMVGIESSQGRIEARVHLDEGVIADTVAVPMGFGHTAWHEYISGKGDNVRKVMTVSAEPGTGTPVWAGSKVKITKL